MSGSRIYQSVFLLTLLCASCASSPVLVEDTGSTGRSEVLFHDCHSHLTNYIQEGLTAKELLEIMGDKVGRAALFGIPLQQKWDYFVSGERAPDYYLLSDASLYYYSFTDAIIAEEYRGLSEEDQKRLDPMITGFNPTDMYAVDHIKRVLKMYPGVFTGIGEFSIHKEFVSAKISGHTASLRNKAFSRILSVAEETGLIAIVHCDINTVRPAKKGAAHFNAIRDVFKIHKDASIIWAHTGLGRYVKPTDNHVALLEEILSDPDLKHVYFDISWDLVADYIVKDDETAEKWAQMMKNYPERFLFGTDAVAPGSQEAYLGPYFAYNKLWDLLDKQTSYLVTMGNYEHLFDAANTKVRAWEAEHIQK